MQIRKILTTFILSLFFIASFAYAEVTTKGIGTVQMKSNDPTNVETKEAKNNAIKSAWKSFVSKFNPSKMKQYNLVKEDIEQNIDEYIISSEVVENIIDQGTKTLKTIIKIKMDLQPFSMNTLKTLFFLFLVYYIVLYLPLTNIPLFDLFYRSVIICLLFIPLVLYFKLSEDLISLFNDFKKSLLSKYSK